MKIILVTQARVGSTRFPNKVIQPLSNTTILGLHLERLKKAKTITKCVVATTHEEGVESIIKIVKENEVEVFQGDLNDVLDRFYQAVVLHQPDYVVRVTSDCPLIDPSLIDEVVNYTCENNFDYGANILMEEFPDGQDIEVFKFKALKRAWSEAKLPSEREHVTPFIRNNTDYKGGRLFNANHYPAPNNYSHIRMTVDEPKDLEAIKTLIEKLGTNRTWQEYTNYIIEHIEEFHNQDIIRNEGYLKSLKNDNI